MPRQLRLGLPLWILRWPANASSEQAQAFRWNAPFYGISFHSCTFWRLPAQRPARGPQTCTFTLAGKRHAASSQRKRVKVFLCILAKDGTGSQIPLAAQSPRPPSSGEKRLKRWLLSRVGRRRLLDDTAGSLRAGSLCPEPLPSVWSFRLTCVAFTSCTPSRIT